MSCKHSVPDLVIGSLIMNSALHLKRVKDIITIYWEHLISCECKRQILFSFKLKCSLCRISKLFILLFLKWVSYAYQGCSFLKNIFSWHGSKISPFEKFTFVDYAKKESDTNLVNSWERKCICNTNSILDQFISS